MPTYVTVQHLAEMFHRDMQTIRRWIDEGRDISFDGRRYVPKKDPGGAWLFIVKIIAPLPDDEPSHPVPLRPRRRVISNGVK